MYLELIIAVVSFLVVGALTFGWKIISSGLSSILEKAIDTGSRKFADILRKDLDHVNDRVNEFKEDVSAIRDDVRFIKESSIETHTELNLLAREQSDIRSQVQNHERRITSLER